MSLDLINKLSEIHRKIDNYNDDIKLNVHRLYGNVCIDANNFTIKDMENCTYIESYIMYDIIACKRFDLLQWCRTHSIMQYKNRKDDIVYNYPYYINEVLFPLAYCTDVEFMERVIDYICLDLGDDQNLRSCHDISFTWLFINNMYRVNNINGLKFYLKRGLEKLGNIFDYNLYNGSKFDAISALSSNAFTEADIIIFLIYLKRRGAHTSIFPMIGLTMSYFFLDLLQNIKLDYLQYVDCKTRINYLIGDVLRLPPVLLNIIYGYITIYDIYLSLK